MQSELRQHWRLLLAASAGVVCSSIVLPFYTMGALLKPLTETFGWSRADVQTALVFSTGLSALTAMGVGWLNDRYGPRPVALPGLVGLALAFFFAANMNGSLWMLYLAYGSMAVLGAGTTPVTWTRALTTQFDRQRGLALGIALTGTGVCAILAPLYTVMLVEHFGWRGAFVGTARRTPRVPISRPPSRAPRTRRTTRGAGCTGSSSTASWSAAPLRPT